MGWQKFGLGMITTCTKNHSIEASWKTLAPCTSPFRSCQSQLLGFETLPRGGPKKGGLPTKRNALRYPQIVRELLQNEELGYRPFASGWVWIREFFWEEGDHITRPKSSDNEGNFFDFKLVTADTFLICLALRELFDQRG